MADQRRCEYETIAGGTFCRHHYGAPSGQCLTAVGEVLVRARQAEAEVLRLRRGMADRDAKHEEQRATLAGALKVAKSTIRTWHSIRLGSQEEPEVWQHYQESPEMRAINTALGIEPLVSPVADTRERDLTREEHVERHRFLHGALDELVADWITKTKRLPSGATVWDLIQWSHGQTENPE